MKRSVRADLLLLLLLVLWLRVSPVQAQIRHPLPVLWMMPCSFGGEEGCPSAGLAPAVRLALQDLKKQPAPLGNYEIQLQLLDSQCEAPAGLKALFDAMWAGPRYLLLFGGVCPPVTSLIARALPALNLVQVSFAAVSPSLSNRKWFGNLFSTVPSDRAVNQAAVKLLQSCRWSRVGVVTQEGAGRSEMKKDLIQQLLKADIQVVATESFRDDACSILKKLKELDVRIIIGQFDEDSAPEVFCCAYRLNLFGSRYQWIITAGAAAGWRWGRQVPDCTADSLLMAADGAVRLQTRRLSNTNTPGVSGRTPRDYQDAYLRELTQERSEVSPLHAFAYDAVWVAAKALSRVMEAAKHREKFSSEKSVSVTEEEVQKMLLEAVKQTNFEGVTGPVFFRNGERMMTMELIQFQGNSSVLVGEFSTNTQKVQLNHQLMFKGSGPAKDRTEVRMEPRRVSLLLYGIVSSVAVVTIIIALTILCFIIINRKYWRLEASDGSQDELLLLGLLLSSSSVLISGLDEASLPDRTVELLCSVRLWILSVGHTVSFSVLLIKTWRIYSVCSINHEQQQNLLQRAGYLLLWLLLLDVFVLISWQILDPLRRVELQHRLEGDAADQDVIIQPFSEHCSSSNMDLWITAVCGYKGPLLGLGCFLAWSIRTVQAEPPRLHSEHLTLNMFAVAVFSVSGVAASLLTSNDPAVHFCLSSSLLLGCNGFILSCLFGTKLFYLWSRGSEKLQRKAAGGEQAAGNEKAAEEEEEEEATDQLSRLNQRLKSRTTQLDAEIETITMQLSDTSEPELLLHPTTREKNHAAELRCVVHAAQVCAEVSSSERKPSSSDNVNSPEHVHRRLTVQLPILHHSYLPAVGGVSTSSSSLFGSRDALAIAVVTSCSPEHMQPESQL